MSKVAIIVKGGLVQAVYSTDENIDVEVYDFDNYMDADEIDYFEDMWNEVEMIRESAEWHSVW